MGLATYDIRQIPEGYYEPAVQGGEIRQLDIPGYQTAAVYLPWGYDNSDRRYNTLYLIHGGGDSPASWFGSDDLLKNLLDHMIADGKLEPLIVAAPTYYEDGCTRKGIADSHAAVKAYGPVLRNVVVPLIEKTFRTAPGRGHRAIGGFSMGGVTTWFAFLEAMDLFRWFLPLSGDCWAFGELGGSSHAAETAALLADHARGQDFYLHALTGTEDIAYPNLNAQIEAMQAYRKEFRGGENFFYSLLEGGVHQYPDIRRYLYHALPDLFRL